MKIEYQDYAVGKPYAWVDTKETLEVEDKHGTYVCKYGDVRMFQTWVKDLKGVQRFMASFSHTFNGRTYYKTIYGKKYTDIGLARKAGEFIKELKERGIYPDPNYRTIFPKGGWNPDEGLVDENYSFHPSIQSMQKIIENINRRLKYRESKKNSLRFHKMRSRVR